MKPYTVDDFPGLPLEVAKMRADVANEAWATRHEPEPAPPIILANPAPISGIADAPKPRKTYNKQWETWEQKQKRLSQKFAPTKRKD